MDESVGAQARIERVVTEDDTAVALGSGDVPVLATPRLLAWAEAATVAALDGRLDDGTTSVGTHVELDHLAASAVGATVTVTAEICAVDGRTVRFTVNGVDAATGRTVATGQVVRVLVDRARFLS